MSDKPFSFEEFKLIYSKVPRLCVDLVILNDKQETLLTRRSIEPWKGMWHLPGGTVFFNEPLRQAAKRLASKELGVDIEVKKEIGTIEFLGQNIPHKFDHSVCVVYLCELISSDFNSNEETGGISFFKELPENIIQEHKEFLENKALSV